jgi:thiol-disulfide isomerase/thioredoxin
LVLIAALFATPALADEVVEFSLPGLDGKPVSLADYRGKWVVVNFWATWCPPCLEEIPDLVDLYEANRERLVVLGVSYEEVNEEYLREFVESHMISYPVMRMDPYPVTPFGPISGLPTTFIVSPEGKTLAQQQGPVTREAIERYITGKEAVTGKEAERTPQAALDVPAVAATAR